MTTSYLWLLVASFATGLIYIVNKSLSREKFPAATFALVTQWMSAVIAIPLLLINFKLAQHPVTWIFILVSTFIYGLSVYFSFKAYQNTDASIVSIVHKFSIVFTAFLGIIFLHEKYYSLSYLGLFFVVMSNIMLIYEKKKIILTLGIIFALLMAVTSAFAGFFDKIILNDFSPFTYVFVNNFLSGLIFCFRKKNITEGFKLLRKNPRLIFLTSLLSNGSWIVFLIVLQNTAVSKTLPIYKSLSLIVPVFLGITLLRETKNIKQKIIGAILGVSGILLLALK
jgi:uncharacterized membrane protein